MGSWSGVLDGADRLGMVVRIDRRPALGALELQIMVWLCSRWRERRDPDSRSVPLALEGLTAELGWGNGRPQPGRGRRSAQRPADGLLPRPDP